jgi:DNA adenine methylase
VTPHRPRRAIASSEAPAVAAVDKAQVSEDPVEVDADESEDGEDGEDGEDIPVVGETYAAKLFVPIMKANKERRTITGVVLEPDTVDAQKDSIPADVILDAAEDFLANINVKTTMGLMHKDMNPPLELVQSFVVSDSDITINSVIVVKGSWVITVRVNSDDIWQQIKDGKLTGFSIGGKAKVQQLKPQAAA